VAKQQLERERQRGGGRLIASGHGGEQLVADLRVGQGASVLITRREQHREHVGAGSGIASPSSDLLEQQRIDGVDALHERPSQRCAGRRRDQVERMAVDHGDKRPPQPEHGSTVGDAEHDAADHLERDHPHPVAQDQPLAGPPAGDLPLRRVTDRL
jgi:hypothetical protein